MRVIATIFYQTDGKHRQNEAKKKQKTLRNILTQVVIKWYYVKVAKSGRAQQEP